MSLKDIRHNQLKLYLISDQLIPGRKRWCWSETKNWIRDIQHATRPVEYCVVFDYVIYWHISLIPYLKRKYLHRFLRGPYLNSAYTFKISSSWIKYLQVHHLLSHSTQAWKLPSVYPPNRRQSTVLNNDDQSTDTYIRHRTSVIYWPFVRGIHRSPVNSRTKASDAGLWCFLWSGPG